MKYKISTSYNADKFCSQFQANDIIYYISKDDNGRSLKELGELLLNGLEAICSYNTLILCNEYNRLLGENK